MPDQTPATSNQLPPGSIDPNVKVPPHVVAAIQKSNDAFNTHFGAGDGQTPGSGDAPPNGAANTGQPTANGTDGGNGAPASHHEDLGPDTNADGTPNWENRFKALKGRYDADQRRTRETLEEYEQRMRVLAQENSQLKQPPLPGSGDPPVLVTDKDKTEYGEDLIDVMKRVAQETILPLLKPIATEIGTVKGQVQTTAQETERQFLQRMHSSMDAAVPGWDELNHDPKFIDWTKKPDVYSGLNRQELLQRAWYAGDSNRVAAFFQGFLAEEAATDPAAAEARQRALAGNDGHAPPAHQPGQPAPNGQHQAAPRVTLEQLAAPGRARAGAPPPAGKPVWTAEGIAQFYQDVAKGVFRGREQERIATEQDLMSAQREGRIQINPRTATTTR